MRYKQEDMHKLEWELKKRKDEIFETSKSLSEAKLALFDER